MRKYRFLWQGPPDETTVPTVTNFIQENLAQGRRVTAEEIILKLKEQNIELKKRTLIRKMNRWVYYGEPLKVGISDK